MTKMDEGYQVLMDVEANLTPLIVRFAKKHYENGDEKELKRIQKRLVGIITSCQPMPQQREETGNER